MRILRLVWETKTPHSQDSQAKTTIFVALYGKKYTEAAKDTWRLFVDRGIVALVNDSLVGMGKPHVHHDYWIPRSFAKAMIWGAYAVGCLSALFAYLYLRSKFRLHSREVYIHSL